MRIFDQAARGEQASERAAVDFLRDVADVTVTGRYADIQQTINLALLEKLRAMNVQLAAPIKALVYIESPAGAGSAAAPGVLPPSQATSVKS